MTRAEFIEVAKRVKANWPHAQIPTESLAKWFDDLAEHEVTTVIAAVESYYRDGREFPPNGGQLLARIGELTAPDLDHGEAYALTLRAAESHGYERGLDWLREQSPAAAEAAEHYPWRQFCLDPAEDGVRRGQFRRIYENVANKRRQRRDYAGLPAPAGRKEIGPRKVGYEELVRGS